MAAKLDAVVAMAGSAGALEVMFDQVRRLVQPDSSSLFLLYHRGDADPYDWSRLLPEGSGFVARPMAQGSPVKPGTIYYPASGVTYGVVAGRMEAIDGHAPPRPNLDLCLTALAQEYGPRLVGVLLSGWGRDGLQGMKAVRAAGGAAIIQDPATADAAQLPQAAVAQRLRAKVLEPGQIVDEVARVLRGAYGRRAGVRAPTRRSASAAKGPTTRSARRTRPGSPLPGTAGTAPTAPKATATRGPRPPPKGPSGTR